MHGLKNIRIVSVCVIAATLALASPVLAQNHYPLEILNIKPVGPAPTGLDADNRIYRAYPGLPYNIRAAVVGGQYPYTFTLSNAPSDMTVNGRGEINWSNPTANAAPTLTIRDSRGAQITTTWSIAVSSTTFRFVDAVNGRNAANNGCSSTCGTGTVSNPWRTMKDVFLNSGANTITYFRRGTYNALDIGRGSIGTPWERVDWSEGGRSVIWLEYPGDAAVIDFGYTGGSEFGPLIRLSGDNIYVDGFETRNSHVIGFQIAPTAAFRGATFRRMYMHDHYGVADGANSSLIMTLSQPSESYGTVVQDSVFANSATCTLKFYSQTNLLLEDNLTRDSEAGPELKAAIRRFTVRGETYTNIAGIAIGGNMHGANGDLPSMNGEIAFNNVAANTTGWALDVNQDSQALQIYTYRNTFRGRIRVRNVDASDGPFTFNNNVILNSDPGDHIARVTVTTPSRIVVGSNLTGTLTDGIVDALGLLTPAYSQWIGIHGHQLDQDDDSAPAPPTNLRIVP
jgi:hypothetical protein